MVLTEFPPSIGGMQAHAVHLARGLAKQGWPLEVLTYRPADRKDARDARRYDAQLPFRVHRVLSRVGHFHNLDVLERAGAELRAGLVYSSTVFYGELGDRLGVPVVCRSAGNDVLRPWIAYPFRLGSRWVATPWIDQRAYRFFRKLSYPEMVEALWRERRRALMTASARRVGRVLANSKFTADLLHEIGVNASRVHIVTGGVDASAYAKARAGSGNRLRSALAIAPERRVLLTACRMVAKKGIELLLASMNALLERVPAAHLLIAGSGRYERRFNRLAAASPAAHRIQFVGAVPHDDMPEYYAMADAFVLASRVHVDPRTGLKDAETMGRVLCEANAAGVPVVAARSGGIPSVIRDGHNGLLFEPDDTASLVDAVARVFEPGVSARLVEAGLRASRERFDWSVIVREHEHCFESLLAGSSAEFVGSAGQRGRGQPGSVSRAL